MNPPIKVNIYTDGRRSYLCRPASTTLDRFDFDFDEIDKLIQDLKSVKIEAANRKRLAAQRLLQEADDLSPIAGGA